MSNNFSLPRDIPWKLIGVSEDMMDRQFCDKAYPPPWNSSLAIYVHEVNPEELPEELQDERITYVKVSCSITGYQPGRDEVVRGVEIISKMRLSDEDKEKLTEKLTQYFACYGVLLNVSVFPKYDPERADPENPDFTKLPYIMDFEPKTRDFYQVTTESGEVLTSSTNKVNVGKSHTHSESMESGINLNVGGDIGYQPGQQSGGVKGGVNANISWKKMRTETDQDNFSVTTDLSRERREKDASTTTLNQMYNLLQGYHAGTNRATFLMLPRPHLLESTNLRTFVQGLRVIEGIQDFFLIVKRPKEILGLKIEAMLETGHFPEILNTIGLDDRDNKEDEFPVLLTANESHTLVRIEDELIKNPSGFLGLANPKEDNNWEYDPDRGIPGKGGLIEIIYPDDNTIIRPPNFNPGSKIIVDKVVKYEILNGNKIETIQFDYDLPKLNATFPVQKVDDNTPALRYYEYKATTTGITINGIIEKGNPDQNKKVKKIIQNVVFHRVFVAQFRSKNKSNVSSHPAINDLTIVARQVCAEVMFEEKYNPLAPMIMKGGKSALSSIVVERLQKLKDADISLNPNVTVRSLTNAFLNSMKLTLLSSWKLPERYKPGEVDFLSSNYFNRELKKHLPKEGLANKVTAVEGFSRSEKEKLEKNFGDVSVEKLVDTPLHEIAARMKISVKDAVSLRAKAVNATMKNIGRE